MLGSGVRNIVKYSKVYSNIDPVFVGGDIFKTQIALNAAKNENAGVNAGANAGVNVGVNLAKTELEVLTCIKEDNTLSTAKIAEKVGKNKRTIERIIKALKEKGYITRIGSDKTGHWEIID